MLADFLTAEAVFKDEELGIEAGEGVSEFCEFCFRSVDFDAGEIGNLEALFEQRADFFDVVQCRISIFVSFAAMSGVAVEAESIIEALIFALGLSNELRAEFFKGVELTVVDGEIRYDGAAGVLGRHGIFVLVED